MLVWCLETTTGTAWRLRHHLCPCGYGLTLKVCWGFPGGSEGEESTCNAGDPGSILGLERFPGGGHGNPLQYSCWRTPWTEQPGGLQSMGWQRVGHSWATKHTAHKACCHRPPLGLSRQNSPWEVAPCAAFPSIECSSAPPAWLPLFSSVPHPLLNPWGQDPEGRQSILLSLNC